MEMSLFKKGGKIWTRFKVDIKQKNYWLAYLFTKYEIDIRNPVKENKRFIYFEKEGDYISEK